MLDAGDAGDAGSWMLGMLDVAKLEFFDEEFLLNVS
jgi:hypothetical protein